MASAPHEDHYRASGLWLGVPVGWLLPRAAYQWPGRVALDVGGHRLTFGQVEAWVGSVAAALRAAGTGRGSVVFSQLPNGVHGIILQLAAWRIGAVSAPVIGLFREHELRSVLDDLRPDVVVAPGRHGGRRPVAEIDRVLGELGIRPATRWALGEGGPGWAPFPEAAAPAPRFVGGADPDPAPSGEACLVLFTSGTTAEPKGVRHSSNSLLAECVSYRDSTGLGSGSRVLAPSAIAHIGGAVATTVLPFLTGCQVAAMASWDVATAVDICDSRPVTLGIGVPVHLADLVDHYESAPGGHRPPRMFAIGGATAPPSLIERAERVGIVAWRAWGMSEAPTVTLAGPDVPLALRAGFDGRIDFGSEVEAVTPDREPLPPGEPGELRLRSPKRMLGYTRPRSTAAQVDADGWFYTGDIGTVTPDGWVSVHGRRKDIINRGGEKFPARDIEAAILTHPAIAQAAVVGAPEPRLGEQVVAYVVLRPGTTWPGEEELRTQLDEMRLARQKIPVAWRVLPTLPATPTGKIRKNELLRYWDEEAGGAP
jgi:acyl-CoA synthetase